MVLAVAVQADNCVTQPDGTVICDVAPAAEGWTEVTTTTSGGSYGSTAYAAAGSHGSTSYARRPVRRVAGAVVRAPFRLIRAWRVNAQERRAARRAHRMSGGSHGSTTHGSGGSAG